MIIKQMRDWRNGQTRTFKGRVGDRVSSSLTSRTIVAMRHFEQLHRDNGGVAFWVDCSSPQQIRYANIRWGPLNLKHCNVFPFLFCYGIIVNNLVLKQVSND